MSVKEKTLACIFALLVAANLALLGLGYRSLHAHSDRIDAVEQQLGAVKDSQQQLTAELGTAENTAADLAESVAVGRSAVITAQDTAADLAGTVAASRKANTAAQGTAEQLDSTIATSGELIGQCQSILADVQARGAKEAE